MEKGVKRKRRYNQPPCMMCVHFQKPVSQTREKTVFCKKVIADVGVDDFCISCFEPVSRFFYCYTYGYYVDVQVCLYRQTRRSIDCGNYYDTCKKCKAGANLFFYVSTNPVQIEYNIKGENK